MKTRILRFERETDLLGKEEIFMQIEVTTDTLICSRGEWLTQSDIDSINNDEANKNIIAQEIAERAILAKNSETESFSPIIPDGEISLN